MTSLLDESDSDDGGSNWQVELQSHRMEIINRVEYFRISPMLQAHMIFDRDDDEEISNQFTHPTSKIQMNRTIDKLLKKGDENYSKFLKILSTSYPDIYKSMTGKEPPPTPEKPPDVIPPHVSSLPGTNDELVAILIERFEQKKFECEELTRQNMIKQREIEEKNREMQNLKSHIDEFRRRSERYESMERDMSALKENLDDVKNQSYTVCMRLVDTEEEKSRLRDRNMKLRMEVDRLKVDLKKMESTVNSERNVSFRLRRTLETGPSVAVIRKLQQEIDDLKLKLAQSNMAMTNLDNDVDTRLQILHTDKEEAIQMYAEATEKLNKLREEFNETETQRDRYIEENEQLNLQVSALSDDCEMYKTRRDAVWQQLQEVEKERDQLLKERNEAQITAQNHMDEKTKYRTQIRKLEEMQDRLSHQLREKENQMRELINRLKKMKLAATPPNDDNDAEPPSSGSTITSTSIGTDDQGWGCTRARVRNIKSFDEFSVKSEFDGTEDQKTLRVSGNDGIFPEIPLAANYGEGCGKILVGECPPNKQRKVRIARKKRTDTRQAPSGARRKTSESPSRTSSTDSEYQRKPDEVGLTLVEIDIKTVQECVKFIGGNQSGIFINQIVESPGCTQSCSMLQPGMQLIKIRQSQKKPSNLYKWTLEYTYNMIRSIEGTVVLMLESRAKEYQDIKDKMKSSRMTGDSFYVRANFKWTRDDMLTFNKFEILHVISTQPFTELHWLACKIDPYNGNNSSKSDVIPSYKYCLKNPQQADLLQKGRRYTEPSLFAPTDPREVSPQFGASMRLSAPDRMSGLKHLVIGRPAEEPQQRYETVGQPYTIMKPLQLPKERPRPCLMLPQSLSTILAYKLTTIAEPLQFDFPVPESSNCAVNVVRSRLYDRDVISFNSLSDEKQEVVTTSSAQKTADMDKHCILSINENCISIKEYLRKLQAEEIYPIVIFLQTDKPRTVKMFIEEDKSKPNVVIQDMILTGEQLKRFGINFATVQLDRCNKVEDAVQMVIEKVVDETNRIVWQEDDSEIFF
uniref:caspase recruitment domain-containing protein 14-like isoform X2 n=1 Tax=Styela clava TaxID=7725 RepID=UPI00193A74D3|nr:caspase recruitment domain-containing protein 14-like isoform X2 [Styela clava]